MKMNSYEILYEIGKCLISIHFKEKRLKRNKFIFIKLNKNITFQIRKYFAHQILTYKALKVVLIRN